MVHGVRPQLLGGMKGYKPSDLHGTSRVHPFKKLGLYITHLQAVG